ncbi:MAG: ABC-2 transporter permease [Clostridia bacterium]|nr:ABC-2 transporter permease [Clostridia bacterium]
MKYLLCKEFRLVMHPVLPFFLLLSAMLLIPSYPFYVVFFYTLLGIFFSCLGGRENHDIDFTLSLPIRKRSAVSARFLFAVIVEMAQLLLAIVFMLLRNALKIGPNLAGMDANIAFLGLSLMLLGIFNASFFRRYYAAPDKVGKAFVFSSIIGFLAILLLEIGAHALPFMRNTLDTPDPQFLPEKILILLLGIFCYASLTFLSWRCSIKTFEQLDL